MLAQVSNLDAIQLKHLLAKVQRRIEFEAELSDPKELPLVFKSQPSSNQLTRQQKSDYYQRHHGPVGGRIYADTETVHPDPYFDFDDDIPF